MATVPRLFWKGAKRMADIKDFLRNETGLELSEYAVAAALITLAAAIAFQQIGEAVTVALANIKSRINGG
jgi:Flp pilus assembly pilin Flp